MTFGLAKCMIYIDKMGIAGNAKRVAQMRANPCNVAGMETQAFSIAYAWQSKSEAVPCKPLASDCYPTLSFKLRKTPQALDIIAPLTLVAISPLRGEDMGLTRHQGHRLTIKDFP